MVQSLPGRLALCAAILLSTFVLRGAVPDPVDLQWKPKKVVGVGGQRAGGANNQRAPGVNNASLFIIAPQSTGLTTQELPTVYWYISDAAKNVKFTLVRMDLKKTVLELEINDVKPGFHKIDLAAEAKKHDIKPLEVNPWAPDADNAPKLDAVYRVGLGSKDLQLAAVSYIARVRAPQGFAPEKIDYTLAVKNELWYDAVQALNSDLRGDPNANKQFDSLLKAEKVLQSEVADSAPAAAKKQALEVEEKVSRQLSVPDPIDLQSDTWKAPAEEK